MTTSEITVTTTWGSKRQVAPYEMDEATVVITETFSGDADPEDVQRCIDSQFITAKASVLGQLRKPFEQDEATGMIFEVFPGAEVVESKPTAKLKAVAPPPVEDDEEDGGDEQEEEASKPAPKPAAKRPAPRKPKLDATDRDSLFFDLMENPDDWTLVESDNPKAPDFRHATLKDPKNSRFTVSLWLRDAPDGFENPFE